MSEKSKSAWLLQWDVSGLGDEDFYCYLVKFPGHENIVALAATKAYDLPERVQFTGNLVKLRKLDFPYNDVRWPLMSDRMLEILEGVRPFEFKKIPITVLDDTVPRAEILAKAEDPGPEHALQTFSGVQLLRHLDVFDWEQSRYERSEGVPNRAKRIRKLALTVPADGFPPLFRVSAIPTLLFVSGEARDALQAAKVKGVEVVALEDYPTPRQP